MGLIKPVSGGVDLPTLNNPAASSQILKDYDAINGAGEKVTGSHVCPDAPELPALSNPAKGAQIMSGYDAVNSTMERVEGTHVCKTLSELLPSRSKPAGANEILTGYQGVDNTGAVVNGAYVPPAAGAEWELITVGNSNNTSTVYHSMSDITHCAVTPSYYQEAEKMWNPGTFELNFVWNKFGGTKTYSTNTSLSETPITYGADGSITAGKPNGGNYVARFRWSHILCVNDSEGVSLIG